MKKTLEWNTPEPTVVDSVSAVALGLESLVARMGEIDASGQANAGALKALNEGIRRPLLDVSHDSLEWIGDLSAELANAGSELECRNEIIADCFAAGSELRRAKANLESDRDNVYGSLTQLKDIRVALRSALSTVLKTTSKTTIELEKSVPTVDRTEPEAAPFSELGTQLTHEYQQCRSSIVERVVNRPPAESSQVVVFTEVSQSAPPSLISARATRVRNACSPRPTKLS